MQLLPLENSYIGLMGKTIEPATPLGYDWKIGIAISLFAAEKFS
jgi:hypothetical protein